MRTLSPFHSCLLTALLLWTVPTQVSSSENTDIKQAQLVLINDEQNRSTDHILQWRLDNLVASDHDVSKTPRLLITGPDKRTWTRPAFLYQDQQLNPEDQSASGLIAHGNTHYRIRHQARAAGKYLWQLQANDKTVISSGSFSVKKGSAPIGPIKIAGTNKRLLSFQNDEVFIPIGCNIAWANAPRRLELIQSYLRKLAANGGTHFRLWMCSWSGQLESNTPDVYRMDHAYLIDHILLTARNLGLYVTVVLDNHHDLVHGESFPYGDDSVKRIAHFLGMPLNKQYQRRVRYILARYGCDDHILAWELFNELDEALYDKGLPQHMPDMHKICATWVPTAARFLKQADQDKRLVTSSLSWQTWQDVAAPKEFDLVQVHEYIPVFERIHPLHHDGLLPMQTHLERLNVLPQAFRFSEIGHNGTNEHNPANEQDPAGLLLCQQAWAGFLFGGYGSGMAWWWDNYIDKNDLWHVYRPIAQITKLINWQDQQLEAIPVNQGSSLRVMGWQSQTQALIWPQIRANTWHALTINGHKPQTYVSQQLVLRGFMPNKAFTITWYSLEDAHKHSEIKVLADENGKIQLACPSKQLMMIAHIRAE